MTVANPTDGMVFRHLMEDERIAHTVLTALLKEDIAAVKKRRHEYAVIGRDGLSILRIDYGATDSDGHGDGHPVSVEPRKAREPTASHRFLQHPGRQNADATDAYAPDADDEPSRRKRDDGIPMAAISLLAHGLGDIEGPVIHVRRQTQDDYEQPVTKAQPNPFVDCLVAAAADSKMRHNMNVEDEYFSLIEEQDTELMTQRKLLAEQGAQLKERDAQLKEQDAQLTTSVRLLYESGMSIEDIAKSLNLSTERIEKLRIERLSIGLTRIDTDI